MAPKCRPCPPLKVRKAWRSRRVAKVEKDRSFPGWVWGQIANIQRSLCLFQYSLLEAIVDRLVDGNRFQIDHRRRV